MYGLPKNSYIVIKVDYSGDLQLSVRMPNRKILGYMK